MYNKMYKKLLTHLILLTVQFELDYDEIAAQDRVVLSVQPGDEGEFNMDNEENADSDNESLHGQIEPDRVLDAPGTSPVADSVATDEIISFNSQPVHKDNPSEMEFEQLKSNPAFQNYVQKLISDELKTSRMAEKNQKTPEKWKIQNKGKNSELIKSPSDTTIYAPALNRITRVNNPELNQLNNISVPFTVDNISKFIEEIRVAPPAQQSEGGRQGEPEVLTVNEDVQEPQPGTSREDNHKPDRYQEARDKAERAIIEAEQY